MQFDPNQDEVDDLASWHGGISKWPLYLPLFRSPAPEPSSQCPGHKTASTVPDYQREIHSLVHHWERHKNK